MRGFSAGYNAVVFERVLQRMRTNVRNHQYVMTVHAWEEMESDGLSIFDVESAILSGKITERQMDRPWGERKYVVRGRPLEGDGVVFVVAKLGPTGQAVILTVYVERA
jgi:hypothetical protein